MKLGYENTRKMDKRNDNNTGHKIIGWTGQEVDTKSLLGNIKNNKKRQQKQFVKKNVLIKRKKINY